MEILLSILLLLVVVAAVAIMPAEEVVPVDLELMYQDIH
jgi:hypothetical protein